MDSLPPQLVESVRPLVFVVGDSPDFGAALVSSLAQLSLQPPATLFRCFGSHRELSIPVRPTEKPPPDGVDYGVLRSDWVGKYGSAVPSLVVHHFGLDIAQGIDCDVREYRCLRELADPFDVKVVVVAVLAGAEGLAAEVLEERLGLLQRKMGTQPRNFVEFRSSDLSVSSAVLRRLHKLVRDLSQAFYSALMKRVKAKIFDVSAHRTLAESMVSYRAAPPLTRLSPWPDTPSSSPSSPSSADRPPSRCGTSARASRRWSTWPR